MACLVTGKYMTPLRRVCNPTNRTNRMKSTFIIASTNTGQTTTRNLKMLTGRAIWPARKPPTGPTATRSTPRQVRQNRKRKSRRTLTSPSWAWWIRSTSSDKMPSMSVIKKRPPNKKKCTFRKSKKWSTRMLPKDNFRKDRVILIRKSCLMTSKKKWKASRKLLAISTNQATNQNSKTMMTTTMSRTRGSCYTL